MRSPFHYAKVFDWDPRMEPFYFVCPKLKVLKNVKKHRMIHISKHQAKPIHVRVPHHIRYRANLAAKQIGQHP